MSDGGFNLRKWNSNLPSLLAMINSDHSDQKGITLAKDRSEYGPDKLLGIQWLQEQDEFRFYLGELQTHARSLPSSKRTILRVTAGIFDPMGFLSPFVILLKVMFQTLCVNKAHWDDPLPPDLAKKWNQLLEELNTLNQVIARCYFELSKEPVRVELHGFSDASEQAYAAVLYLKTCYSDGSVSVRLVASKTKVAP